MPPQTVHWGSERVIYLNQCRYWGGYGGSVISHDDRIISEISPDVWGIGRHTLFGVMKLPAPERLEGLTAIVSTPEANTNYSHWMVDLVPRFALLAEAGFGPEKVDRYLVNVGRAKYCLESLDLIGIPPSKIVSVDDATHLICEEAVTTSIRPDHWHDSMPSHIPKTLTGLFRTKSTELGEPTDKIYIRRGNAGHRRVANEAEILPWLGELGFRALELESLPIERQIRIFRAARVVLGAHGSGLTNIAFCQPGAELIEVHSHDYFDSSFWTMATAAGITYRTMVAKRASGPVPATVMEARSQDLLLNPAALLPNLVPKRMPI